MREPPIHLGVVGLLCLVPAYGCGTQQQSRSGVAQDAGVGGCGGKLCDGPSSPVFPPPLSSSDASVPPPVCACGVVLESDCPGCTFPPAGAPDCANASPIHIVYPPDNVLLPPNLNVLSVQFTPYGGPFQRFSVEFSSPPALDWHILTACASQTVDAQSGVPSGGCELTVDPVSWSKLVSANRDSGPVTLRVRGTTDGVCASTSTNSVFVSFAKEDVLGTYYYWKSGLSPSSAGAQVWKKAFGDLNTSEQDVTSPVLSGGRCNGCHTLSRDGTRLLVYSDDNDSDDEYSDLTGWLLDTSATPNPTTIAVGPGGASGRQSPGFAAIHPLNTYYVTSNGLPWTAVDGSVNVPANDWSLWNGNLGNFVGAVTVGAPGTRPTMPDWSIDGTSIVYVQPSAVARWSSGADSGAARSDDAHIFGGSLFTVPYLGDGGFGPSTRLLQSNGENNYYPSYSPGGVDASASPRPSAFVLFNRVANDADAGTNCYGGYCPNDSFSNPAARLMIVANLAGSTPIDLEIANGSPAASPEPLSNSCPRWAPVVQTEHGNPLLWITFSSTRDYGLRLLNHKANMHQCYPAGSPETPGDAGAGGFAANCQQPQLWMAPIFPLQVQRNQGDPSGPAFWIPYQDITTHNHCAQWTGPLPIKGPPPP